MDANKSAAGWWPPVIAAMLLLSAAGWSHAQQMVFPTSQWVTSTPESVLVDPQALNNAISYIESVAGSPGSEEMVVIRNGRLIWEGSASGRAHHTWSVTKSFTSTMLGLAIDDRLVTLDTLVSDYVPAVGDLYPEMTLRHAATHTSGYIARGEPYPLQAVEVQDPFAPATPLFTPPGSMYAYSNTPLTQMMNVLTRVVGEPMQDFFERRIGEPIGMDLQNWDWGHYTTDDGLAVDGGGGYLGKGVVVSATDLARYGHLFLNKGNWDGEQLLSADWIEQATTVQVPSNVPRHPDSIGGPGFYGYGWWVDDDVFAALGYENNSLLVWPDADLVVARLGTDTINVSWLDAVADRFSQAMQTIAVWDGEGDGTWEEFEIQTGKSRWIGEGDTRLLVYPDKHPGSVRIDSNVVTATQDHRINELTLGADAQLRVMAATLSVNSLSLLPYASLQTAGNIRVEQSLVIHEDARLQFTLDDSRSDPYVVFSRTTSSSLGGILELLLPTDAEPADLVGHSFNLFDWNRRRSGEFTAVVVPPATQWDLSQLYVSGEVTLIAVPEPTTFLLIGLVAAIITQLRTRTATRGDD